MSIDMKKVISGVRLAGVAAHPDKKAILEDSLWCA